MTPAEYQAIVEKHGITPRTGIYLEKLLDGKCLACAIGIRLIEAAGGIDNALILKEHCGTNTRTALYTRTSLSPQFLKGLDDGWENYRRSGWHGNDYEDGFREGAAARELLQPPKIGTR
jgi:hypothetical protein